MINKEVLSEKLKYLITTNAKANRFNILDMYVEFDFTDLSNTKLESYDIDVKFDYEGALEFGIYAFSSDIRKMSIKLREIVSEYVISQDGKIVYGKNNNAYTTEPMVYNIEYKVDETHIFELGYRFDYHD